MAVYKFRKLKELYEPYNKMCRDKVSTWEDRDVYTDLEELPYGKIYVITLLFPDLSYRDGFRSIQVFPTSYYELTSISEDTNNSWELSTETAVVKRLLKIFSEKRECVEW